jgi:hypothetical protein
MKNRNIKSNTKTITPLLDPEFSIEAEKRSKMKLYKIMRNLDLTFLRSYRIPKKPKKTGSDAKVLSVFKES